ncbi:MAG: Tad domain-containing protein [Pseudomonadota bacterium]
MPQRKNSRRARRAIGLSFTQSIARQYVKSERGGFTIFTVVILISMIVLSGLSVDFLRHEILRADLQNAIDRGVLAATNLSAKLEGTMLDEHGNPKPMSEEQVAERIVQEYIDARNIDHRTNIQVVLTADSINDRAVAASAVSAIPTIFFRMVGLDQIDVIVAAGALQMIPKKTEIALVLDISGSMDKTTTVVTEGLAEDIPVSLVDVAAGTAQVTKMDLLKSAAREFFATVLSGDTDNVLISIVPFTGRVTIPSDIAHLYQGYQPHHTYHDCFDHNDLDFTSTAIPMGPGSIYNQPAHFRQGNQQYRTNTFWVYDCPHIGTARDGTTQVNNHFFPYSNDIGNLTSFINQIEHEFFTQTQMGLKFGISLLDPAAAPIVQYKQSLPESDPGHLTSDFNGYPNAWDDAGARKFIVLMADGENTSMYSVDPSKYSYTAEKAAQLHSQNNPPWGKSDTKIYKEVDGVAADSMMQNICSAMQQKRLLRPDPTDDGLRIFSIGFEIATNPHALGQLKDCARAYGADPSAEVPTFYQAEGAEISKIFQAIADEIVNLKLYN